MTNEQPNQLGSDWESSKQEAHSHDASAQETPAQMPWQSNGGSVSSQPAQRAHAVSPVQSADMPGNGQQAAQWNSRPEPQAGRNMPEQWHQGSHAVQATPHPGGAPLGKIRGTGISIVLMIVTLGIYGIYWMCASHSEMKKHTGQGVGGVGAFFLSCIPFVMTFLTPSEVGRLYLRQNRHAPVSAMTGFWTLVPFVGVFIWFAQINGALNDYWRSMGAVEG